MSDIPDHPGARRMLPLLGLLAVTIAGAVFLRDVLSFEALGDNRAALLAFRDDHYAAAALGFIAVYVVIVAFSLPGALAATLTGGFLFGVVPGALFSVLGAGTGAVAIFLAVRWGLGDWLSRRMETGDGMVHRIKAGIDNNQWSMLFLIRLIPAVPFFAANLIPALVGVPLHRFAVSTFLGIIPGSLVYTSLGAGLGETLDRGEAPDLGLIFEPHILLPILGLCLLAALPMLLKALRGREGL